MPNRDSALIGHLIRALRSHGSWCGETHVQKASYVAQARFKTPLPFKYILYKHGPYSFDLSSHLVVMQARGEIIPERVPGYGPRLDVSERWRKIATGFEIENTDMLAIDAIAAFFGGRGVDELEKISTAWYVTEALGQEATVGSRAKRLTEHKPHVALSEAEKAVAESDQLRSVLSAL